MIPQPKFQIQQTVWVICGDDLIEEQVIGGIETFIGQKTNEFDMTIKTEKPIINYWFYGDPEPKPETDVFQDKASAKQFLIDKINNL